MFKCIIDDIGKLTNVFECISAIVDTIVLMTDSDGFRLTALDKSHINFVSADFKKSFFTEYLCEEPFKIIVDSKELVKVLKRARTDDELSLSVDDNYLYCTFTGASTRKFSIGLLHDNYGSPRKPDMSFMVNDLSIPFTEFKRSLGDAELCGEVVSLSVDNEFFRMSCDGDDGSYSQKYLHGMSIGVSCSARYTIEFLKSFLKLDKVSGVVNLSLSDDAPLVLKIGDVLSSLSLEFLCAPRLEAET